MQGVCLSMLVGMVMLVHSRDYALNNTLTLYYQCLSAHNFTIGGISNYFLLFPPVCYVGIPLTKLLLSLEQECVDEKLHTHTHTHTHTHRSPLQGFTIALAKHLVSMTTLLRVMMPNIGTSSGQRRAVSVPDWSYGGLLTNNR